MSNTSDLPLRELFVASERLLNELSEHLEQSLLPRIAKLQACTAESARSQTGDEVSDSSVREAAMALTTSDDFAQLLIEKLESMLEETAQRVARLNSGKMS